MDTRVGSEWLHPLVQIAPTGWRNTPHHLYGLKVLENKTTTHERAIRTAVEVMSKKAKPNSRPSEEQRQ